MFTLQEYDVHYHSKDRKIFFFKQMNTFIQQGYINLKKSDGKGIYIVKKYQLLINAVLLKVLFSLRNVE